MSRPSTHSASRLALLAAGWWLAAGCGNTPKPADAEPPRPQVAAAAPNAVTWSPALGLQSLGDLDARLHKKWDDHFQAKSGGKTVSMDNCADYLALPGTRLDFPNEPERSAFRLAALDCLALDALRTAKPPQSTDLKDFHLTPDAIDRLPAELGAVASDEDAKLVREAAAEGSSWKQFEPDIRAAAGDAGELVVTGSGYVTRLAEMGRGDFSGGGKEEILVRSLNRAVRGSWNMARLFLLSRDSSKPLLTIQKRYLPPGLR